ncbi:MAG: cell division protein ZipA [Gammaproteobacteria bacterium]|nr:MAG: cell division protein ZipA [Gammaproteobacteria bacterium]RKZ40979.1 MAG: cell division protein ZipA [Gammaproteobacteria bacterium]RKZ76851.1 MAG: cell division protein ZipA [Gammaproteobacteria bacterium]
MNIWFGILGIIGIVIGAVFLWKHNKRKRRHRRVVEMADRPESDLYADRYFDEPLISSETNNSGVNNQAESLYDNSIDKLMSMQNFETSFPSELASEINSPIEKTTTISSKKKARTSEMIIALYVVARREVGFAGSHVLTLLEDLGLKYGEMNIFHHYGVGDFKVQQAVFSVANMVEPGTFEPQYMSDLRTAGLALFMRLPGPFGGRVAYELMLNSAQRIAESLDGFLEDEGHAPLDQKKINILRDRIANFEQRNTNLSIPKRFSS